VKELIVEHLKINENAKSMKYKELDVKNCTFPELRSLEMSSVANFATIKEAFDAVDSLNHLKFSSVSLSEWEVYQQLLFKQTDLRSLEFDWVNVGSFELKNWNLEKLVLNGVEFPNREVFQTFVNFIKTLSNVSDLELNCYFDEFRNGNNYKEILEHLLNLPSLTKLKWKKWGGPQKALNIHNPFVKWVVIENFSEVGRYFPNIETLELMGSVFNNITDINLLVNLRELKFNYMGPEFLGMINCPQIRKITIDCDIQSTKPIAWKDFVSRHPNVDYVELKGGHVLWRKSYGPHFIVHFKSFPALKTLKYLDNVNTWPLVKFIGENLTGLEHLEIVVNQSNVEEATEYLRLKFPHLGCDSRKLQKPKFGGWDWLVTLRKF
jgi:hypothetical protein